MTENRLKFRVYDIRRKVYFNDPVPPLNSDGTLAFQSSHPDFQKYYITEFCTGLSDKNGNLIYEGDIVEITIFGSVGPNGGYVDSDEIYKGTVVWDRDCFLVKTDTDMILFPHSEDCTEIIGNIHEQTEQKDVK